MGWCPGQIDEVRSPTRLPSSRIARYICPFFPPSVISPRLCVCSLLQYMPAFVGFAVTTLLREGEQALKGEILRVMCMNIVSSWR